MSNIDTSIIRYINKKRKENSIYYLRSPNSIRQITGEIPAQYMLSQNYPNPFNPSTQIKYQITNNSIVTLKVFDINGKQIETLVNEKQSPGTYRVDWNASQYPS